MKKFSFALLFLGLIGLAACTQSVNAQEEVYVNIDINPSIELIVNPRDIVVYVNALNEDAEILLSDIVVVGLPLEQAVDLIIETAISLGFIELDEEVEIAVSAVALNEEVRQRILERVKNHVNKAFENRAMLGRAVDKAFGQAFVLEAQSYGVTPGFLRIAQSVLLTTDAYTLEELLEMDQEALTEMLKTFKTENQLLIKNLQEAFSLERQLIWDTYKPQIEALELLLESDDPLVDEEDVLAQIEALKTQMRAELEALRLSFKEQSEVLRSQIRLVHQQRKEEHRAHVESFLEDKDARREEMKERIENYQKGRPNHND